MTTSLLRPNSCSLGALYGLAIGDALGAAVEFMARGSFTPVTSYRAGGPHGLNPGEWTDDTSMALALLDSIKTVGWDLEDQMRRYQNWWLHGEYSVNGRCFDIGNTVHDALSNFRSGIPTKQCGLIDHHSQGNGCLMRLAPVPMTYYNLLNDDPHRLVSMLSESSQTTHRHPVCLAATVYLGFVLAALMNQESPETIFRTDWWCLEFLNKNGCLTDEVAALADGQFKLKKYSDLSSTGYVIHSLESALWTFYYGKTFEEVVLSAVNLGGDADTVGAIAGQLAGAHWGMEGIPAALLRDLSEHPLLPKIKT